MAPNEPWDRINAIEETRDAESMATMKPPPPGWQKRHVLLWLLLAGLVCWWRGPDFRRAFEPDFYPPGYTLFLPDFFQEWASARNRFNGLAIYTPQEITLGRYLGLQRPPNDPDFIGLNAHPPTSVLLGIPFAPLEFADAFALWNVLSLTCLAVSAGLIVLHLDLPVSVWDLLPAVTLLLLARPFWHQMVHGQLNLLLLLLVTGVWVANRCRHSRWAGTLLALATAIKLFPGFLFVYFVLRRDWPAVRAGLIALAAISGLTALILGLDTYRDYFGEVLPQTSLYRCDWSNLSLSGLWFKLFDPRKQWSWLEIRPLLWSPALAWTGMACSLAAVMAVLYRMVPRLCSRSDSDLAFALCLIAMLLVSPITWDHYLLLLALPLAVLWPRLPRGGMGREAVVLFLAILWLKPWMVAEHLLILLDASHSPTTRGWIATPLETLTALSAPCYALVGLFVLTLWAAGRDRLAAPAPAEQAAA